jgi:acyl-CoA thioester hydrolase
MNSFEWPVRIYYEDTDAGGVVYYANYLKFMERARTEWLRSAGFEQDVLLHDLNLAFVVKSIKVDYRSPARFNNALVVKTQVIELSRARLRLAHTIFLADTDQCLVSGEVTLACIDITQFKPKAIPQAIRGVFE